MSDLRVFRMKPPDDALLMHPKSARALILASCVDEAYGLALEMLPEVEWGAAAEELPPSELIAAFDYFNAARMIVSQSGSAWAAHYGRPLVLRAKATVMSRPERNGFGFTYYAVNLWGESRVRNSERVDAAVVNEGEDEKVRRVRIYDFLHEKMAVNVREVLGEARTHAGRFLPVPLRARMRAKRKR